MPDEATGAEATGAGKVAGPQAPAQRSGAAGVETSADAGTAVGVGAGGEPVLEAEVGAVADAAVGEEGGKADEVAPEKVAEAGPTIRLDRKHPLAIRWMHWINFPVLFTMIWSGLLIYWGDSDNSYLHPHRVYRVGVGSLTLLRFFPEWFYRWLNAPYRITTGLGYHFFFMWIFALNGVIYVLYTILSGEWRLIVPDRKSLREAIQVTLVDLHLRKGLPPQKKYNGAQKIAYTATILMGLGSLVTGLAIYKPTQVHLVTTLLGGYEMARWLHFWLTIGFSAFFVVHVVQVVMAGWNNFRSMVSGYEIVPVEKASLEQERRG